MCWWLYEVLITFYYSNSLLIAFLFDIKVHQGPTCYQQAGTLASPPLHTLYVGPKLNLAMCYILLLWETNKSKCSKPGNSDTFVDTKECNCISIMTDTSSIIDAKRHQQLYYALSRPHADILTFLTEITKRPKPLPTGISIKSIIMDSFFFLLFYLLLWCYGNVEQENNYVFIVAFGRINVSK